MDLVRSLMPTCPHAHSEPCATTRRQHAHRARVPDHHVPVAARADHVLVHPHDLSLEVAVVHPLFLHPRLAGAEHLPLLEYIRSSISSTAASWSCRPRLPPARSSACSSPSTAGGSGPSCGRSPGARRRYPSHGSGRHAATRPASTCPTPLIASMCAAGRSFGRLVLVRQVHGVRVPVPREIRRGERVLRRDAEVHADDLRPVPRDLDRVDDDVSSDTGKMRPAPCSGIPLERMSRSCGRRAARRCAFISRSGAARRPTSP
jgi:hypothetical protein